MLTFLVLTLLTQVPHQHHPPQSAAEYARVLNDPARDAWQKPHEVVMALALRKDEAIADIGAGTGYFAGRFARHAGKVYAEDVDAKLLDIIKQNAPDNLVTVLGTADDPKLPPVSVDTLFFCNVLHHIDNRAVFLPRLLKALKPGGRIVVLEFHKRELPVGPPVAMKLSPEEVNAEFAAHGFRPAKMHDFLPNQWFIEYRK
jgi:ubiquinone/menaquinone biosynthesis C-methylase UbiE